MNLLHWACSFPISHIFLAKRVSDVRYNLADVYGVKVVLLSYQYRYISVYVSIKTFFCRSCITSTATRPVILKIKRAEF